MSKIYELYHIMEYLIILLLIISCLLSYIEDYIPNKYKFSIFVLLGICLWLIAGFKEIGLDPDSENYAAAFQTCFSDKESTYEYSYILICQMLNFFTSDPQIIFFFYAFWGILLKFIAFYKYNSNLLFIFVAIYISFFFEAHEMMQIRTAILSGLFLLSILEILHNKRFIAFFYIAVGFIFHASAVVLLPFLFFSTKPIGKKEKVFLIIFVIAALGMSFSGNGILDLFANIPFIGDKIALYTQLADHGLSVNRVNGFGIFNLLAVAIALYLLLFSTTITNNDKNFPLLARIYVCGVAAYTMLSFIPELGARVSMLYKIVSIFVFADIIYTIKPKWAAIMILQVMLLIYLHYGLQFLGVDFLWATEI